MTLAQLASLLQGEAHGPFELPLDGPGAYDDAQDGQVVVAFDEAAVALAEAGPAAAVVVPRGLTSAKPTIEVDDPRQALARLLVAFAPSSAPAGVHPSAVVDPSVAVGPDVTIGPGAVVEADVVLGARCQLGPRCVVTAGCRLGDDVRLHPGVVLYPKTVLGNRVVIHAGSVIGADGFGYQFESGRHHKIPQLGQVIIDDDVEIGANTTIDRATLGATRIGEGTKIDNLVMIAHNCKIGRHCVIISQVGIAGSVEVGDYAVIAGQVGVKDHLKIGPQAVIAAQSGVMRDVEPKAVMAGSPAMPQQQWFRQIAGYKRMHDMHLRLRRVESRLGLGEQPDA